MGNISENTTVLGFGTIRQVTMLVTCVYMHVSAVTKFLGGGPRLGVCGDPRGHPPLNETLKNSLEQAMVDTVPPDKRLPLRSLPVGTLSDGRSLRCYYFTCLFHITGRPILWLITDHKGQFYNISVFSNLFLGPLPLMVLGLPLMVFL